ncbi:MAG: cyclic pyranopterin monophosphate synthase MoaC [Planctomycetota bacterium]
MKLSHLTPKGSIKMVNIGAKDVTARMARASAWVKMKPATYKAITADKIKKGNVLEAARLAGIMAAKATHTMIPLCHPINITNIRIDFKLAKLNKVEITSLVECIDRTGAEMEALAAVSVAGLTIYDMCKAIDRGMVIGDIKLIEKSGGKSGYWKYNHKDTKSTK